MKKLSICVVFGGVSSEHSVSEVSASAVLDNIDRSKYEVHAVGITEEGKWLYYDGEVAKIREHNWESGNVTPAILSPDRTDKALIKLGDTLEKIKIDVVYPVLHGKNGEDGTIQGLCRLAGIPCVGSDVIGSAACMDKCIAKILFEKAGIPQADWAELKLGDTPDFDMIERKLGYPCFIKPSSAGSSVGVTKASSREELEAGITLALEHDYKVLIEEAINAREVECSVMGNLEPETADVLGEIKPAKEFYDFEAKYQDEDSKLMIPAPVDAETESKIKEYAKRAYKICECRGYSRVDFFVEKTTGKIYLNEINTIPGFTPISMYPKLWEHSGMPMREVIDRHIELAVSRED
ncbi:MAG: D-alanine--D-alanine ligase family protein [Clostridia bacterium]|nr:D-alanine--D-alanine ligase family protein [Clostridia bacterium]